MHVAASAGTVQSCNMYIKMKAVREAHQVSLSKGNQEPLRCLHCPAKWLPMYGIDRMIIMKEHLSILWTGNRSVFMTLSFHCTMNLSTTIRDL